MTTPSPLFSARPITGKTAEKIVGIVVALLIAAPAQSAVLKVGPNGDFATLQAALDIAVSNNEDDNILIQQGVIGSINASATHAEDRFLDITGGWNDDFSMGSGDPGSTVLSANQAGRVLTLNVSAGTVLIRDLTIANGAAAFGSGALIDASGSAMLQLSDCTIRDNSAFGAASSSGAGMQITISQTAEVELDRCLFVNNSINSVDAAGAGLMLIAGDGRFRSDGLAMINNTAIGSATARGGAIAVELGAADPSVEFRQLQVRSNRVSAPSAVAGAGMFIQGSSGVQTLVIEGAEFARNFGPMSPVAAQLGIEGDDGTYRLRSVALFDGIDASGLRVEVGGTAQVVSANLTSAGNDRDGIRHEANSSSTQALQNSLSWGNGQSDLITDNFSGGFQLFLNSTINPGVIDAASGDYRLATGSSSIDACSASPIAGLGTIDAQGGPRAVNGTVDCGAYEWSADDEDGIFRSGFEAQ